MKIIKFLKKNSSTVVGVSVFILVIVAALLIKNLFMYDENQAIYGNRLDGIDKVKVSSEQKKKVETKKKRNEYEYVQDMLREKLDTKVKIKDKKIEITFVSTQDLNRILEIMNIKE